MFSRYTLEYALRNVHKIINHRYTIHHADYSHLSCLAGYWIIIVNRAFSVFLIRRVVVVCDDASGNRPSKSVERSLYSVAAGSAAIATTAFGILVLFRSPVLCNKTRAGRPFCTLRNTLFRPNHTSCRLRQRRLFITLCTRFDLYFPVWTSQRNVKATILIIIVQM